MAFRDVYTFGPTFRAENSYTRAPCGRVLDDRAGNGLLRPATATWKWREAMVKYIITPRDGALPGRAGVFQQLCGQGPCLSGSQHVAEYDFARVTYTEAVSSLKKSGAEVRISRRVGHATFKPSMSVTSPSRYSSAPCSSRTIRKEIKAFYMRLNDDGKTVAAADLPGSGRRRDDRRQPARGAHRICSKQRIRGARA